MQEHPYIGRNHKRWWRIVVARKYIGWRAEQRPITLGVRVLMMDGQNNLQERGRIYSPKHALKAHRAFENRCWFLPPSKDKVRVESTRLWQIKNKLNYGRY